MEMTLRTLKTPLLCLATLLSACPGGDPPAGNDPPGAPDLAGAPDQAQAAGTTVSVRDGKGAPVADIDVLVSDEAGAPVQTYKTGPGGEVQVTVPPGGTVAALQQDGGDRYIDAVAAPPPGARLTFLTPATGGGGAQPTQLSLTLSKLPAGARQLRFYTGCRSGAQAATETTLKVEACEVAGKYDVVVIATDDAGKRLGWGALLAQAPKPAQTVMGDLPLDRTDFSAVDLELSGVAGRRATARLLPRGEVATRVPTLADRASAQSPPMGLLKARLTLPSLSPEGFRVSVAAARDLPESATNTFAGTVTRVRPYKSLPATLAETLEGAPEVSLGDPDLADATRPRYAWQLSKPFTGDAGVLSAQYDTDQGTLTYTLTFPVEHAPAQRLQALPAALGAYAVDKTAQHAFGQVTYYDYDEVAGYAEYLDRAKVEASPGSLITFGSFTKKP